MAGIRQTEVQAEIAQDHTVPHSDEETAIEEQVDLKDTGCAHSCHNHYRENFSGKRSWSLCQGRLNVGKGGGKRRRSSQLDWITRDEI